jgi:hypothetical protein
MIFSFKFTQKKNKKQEMKQSSSSFSTFAEGVISISELYVANGSSFTPHGYDPVLAAQLKTLADGVLQNYVAEHHSNLPLPEQVAIMQAYTEAYGVLGLDYYLQDLVSVHTEVPQYAESHIMQKTRTASSIINPLFQMKPGLYQFFEGLHSIWHKGSTA